MPRKQQKNEEEDLSTEQENGGSGFDTELNEDFTESSDIDEMWNEYKFSEATWEAHTRIIRALVKNIRSVKTNKSQRIQIELDPNSIEVIEGDSDALRTVKPNVAYTYKKEGGRCMWTFGLRAAKLAGAQDQGDIVGHVVTLERCVCNFDKNDFYIGSEINPNLKDYQVYKMLITEIE